MIYGSYDDFLRAAETEQGELFKRYGRLVEVVMLEGDVDGLAGCPFRRQ
jgi:hypothetical protein